MSSCERGSTAAWPRPGARTHLSVYWASRLRLAAPCSRHSPAGCPGLGHLICRVSLHKTNPQSADSARPALKTRGQGARCSRRRLLSPPLLSSSSLLFQFICFLTPLWALNHDYYKHDTVSVYGADAVFTRTTCLQRRCIARCFLPASQERGTAPNAEPAACRPQPQPCFSGAGRISSPCHRDEPTLPRRAHAWDPSSSPPVLRAI